jgi:chaperonin GroES
MQSPQEATLAEAFDPNEIIELPLEEGEPQAAVEPSVASALPVEETNLAEDLDEEELKKIADKVIKSYESDLESRNEWEERHASWLKLYYQSDKATNPPWEGASEESLPVLTEAVNQFQSRSYKAFFPNRYFVDAIPAGKSNPDARERAERIAGHINFQLGVLDRTYKRNKNQMFMAVALHGSDFTKTYFDHLKRRTVIERVRAADLIVPYHVGPKGIEELERKTHRKFMSVNDTKILKKMGYFINEGTAYTGDSGEVQETVDENQGIDEGDLPENTGDALILEQHGILDLDEDGIAEPYIIWVDHQSKKILRIQIRYEVDEFGAPTKDKEPIEYFTHYQFLPNPDGFYGFGFGHLLAKINYALNKLIRMFIDAGELSTVGNLTYLISEALGIEGDDFELVMGQGMKIPRSIDDIRKHFMKLEFAGPTPALQAAIQYLQETSQRISSSSDILAGQPDKVYQPQALLTMLEQGLQLYSSVQEFLGYSMEDELQKVYRLNAKYLQSEEYFFEGDKQITVTPEDYRDDFRIVPVFDPKYSTRSQKLAKAQTTYEFTVANPLTAQNPQSIYIASKRVYEALDAENIDELLPPPSVPQVARIDDQNLENSYFIMPPDKRPLFDVFPDQDHMRHIQTIDQFISSFLDQGEAMEIPLQGEDLDKTKQSAEPGAAKPKTNTMGDPGIKRLVQSMSTEQKEELVANLLRHRSMHLGIMHGQLNGAMDMFGNPIQQGAMNGQGNPAGGADPQQMAAEPNDAAGLAEITQLLSAAGMA